LIGLGKGNCEVRRICCIGGSWLITHSGLGQVIYPWTWGKQHPRSSLLLHTHASAQFSLSYNIHILPFPYFAVLGPPKFLFSLS